MMNGGLVSKEIEPEDRDKVDGGKSNRKLVFAQKCTHPIMIFSFFMKQQISGKQASIFKEELTNSLMGYIWSAKEKIDINTDM